MSRNTYLSIFGLVSCRALDFTDMPELAPPLTAAEYQIVKSYGDWTSFMQAYGLKPWDEDDIQEAHAIVQTMAREDERQQGR